MHYAQHQSAAGDGRTSIKIFLAKPTAKKEAPLDGRYRIQKEQKSAPFRRVLERTRAPHFALTAPGKNNSPTLEHINPPCAWSELRLHTPREGEGGKRNEVCGFLCVFGF